MYVDDNIDTLAMSEVCELESRPAAAATAKREATHKVFKACRFAQFLFPLHTVLAGAFHFEVEETGLPCDLSRKQVACSIKQDLGTFSPFPEMAWCGLPGRVFAR